MWVSLGLEETDTIEQAITNLILKVEFIANIEMLDRDTARVLKRFDRIKEV